MTTPQPSVIAGWIRDELQNLPAAQWPIDVRYWLKAADEGLSSDGQPSPNVLGFVAKAITSMVHKDISFMGTIQGAQCGMCGGAAIGWTIRSTVNEYSLLSGSATSYAQGVADWIEDRLDAYVTEYSNAWPSYIETWYTARSGGTDGDHPPESYGWIAAAVEASANGFPTRPSGVAVSQMTRATAAALGNAIIAAT